MMTDGNPMKKEMKMSNNYPIGTELRWGRTKGEVVTAEEIGKSFVLPSDICVKWETGESSTYDKWFLDEHCKKINI